MSDAQFVVLGSWGLIACGGRVGQLLAIVLLIPVIIIESAQ